MHYFFRSIIIRIIAIALIFFFYIISDAQAQTKNFRIRTITAGINLKNISDTNAINRAVDFLKNAEKVFISKGYEVQTLRVTTQNFYLYGQCNETAIQQLIVLDKIAQRNNMRLAIGQLIKGDGYVDGIGDWSVKLVQNTKKVFFSVPISSHPIGIHKKSIRAAAEIFNAIAHNTENGEGNFQFSAAANCQPNTPFYPVSFHEGIESFGIGLEFPNLITESFSKGDKKDAKEKLTKDLETAFFPVQQIAEELSKSQHWKYDGIDASPAPGTDASIGAAIEAYTKEPFGSASTLSACAMITDVLKSLHVKKCGYSGLMLPVIEDKILADRASENRYTVKEVLLYSAVSGTGLDVVPLPGNTTVQQLENLMTDVAALSLKYTAKALSARLFLIPGKNEGDWVEFKDPSLVKCRVMKID